MFFHRQQLQHRASPDRTDAVYACKLQEVAVHAASARTSS